MCHCVATLGAALTWCAYVFHTSLGRVPPPPSSALDGLQVLGTTRCTQQVRRKRAVSVLRARSPCGCGAASLQALARCLYAQAAMGPAADRPPSHRPRCSVPAFPHRFRAPCLCILCIPSCPNPRPCPGPFTQPRSYGFFAAWPGWGKAPRTVHCTYPALPTRRRGAALASPVLSLTLREKVAAGGLQLGPDKHMWADNTPHVYHPAQKTQTLHPIHLIGMVVELLGQFGKRHPAVACKR